MKLNDYFERVRVINLPDRRDRRRQMEQQLERVGARADFFPAVRMTEAGDWPSIGARGCFQSHFRILQAAHHQGVGNLLILEDDLDFVPEFKEIESRILSQIAVADWDLLYLGHVLGMSAGDNPLVVTNEPLMTAYFYAVNGRVLSRLVEFLNLVQMRDAGDPLGGPQHVDGALCMFRAQNPDVRTLIVCPPMGVQRPSRSDITSAWYDRLPIVGAMINTARRVRRVIASEA